MKTWLLFVVFAFMLNFSSYTQAQSDTLRTFRKYKPRSGWGFTVAPTGIYTRISNQPSVLVGLHAGVNWRSRLAAGVFYYTLPGTLTDETFGNFYYLQKFRHHGLYVEYTNKGVGFLTMSTGLAVGQGTAKLVKSAEEKWQKFTTITTHVGFNIRIDRNVFAYTGVGLRLATQFQAEAVSNEDISAADIFLGLKVGLFR